LNAVQAQLALKILMGLIRKLLLLNKSRNLEKIVAVSGLSRALRQDRSHLSFFAVT